MSEPPELARITDSAQRHRLACFGALHLDADELPGCASLVLLGPAEPGFWAHVTATPEFADGAPDPLDRWSRRVIGALADELACEIGARALFPFGGPPWHPFIGWARRSGRAWPSPVGLLVHDTAGLMLSYRGALALPERIALPPRGCAPATAAPISPAAAPARSRPSAPTATTCPPARPISTGPAMTAWRAAVPCAAPAR